MSDLATRTPRQELETVLDPAHAQAVIEHRKAKRAPLTPHAASLLAKQFAKATELKLCSDANAAADEMIARGWQGFKPEWLKEPSGPTAVSVHRPATKIPDFQDPPPEVRERMIAKFKALSQNVAAAVAMDKPHPVQQRDRWR